MTSYLLIETRDPFDACDTRHSFDLARQLSDHGPVTVFLAQNAVLPTRRASAAAGLLRALAGHATVLADEFSLRERGITDAELVDGVTPAPIDRMVELLTEDGRTAVWH
jgi:sulfur relay (sulfurtransferase) complex TusBCD TusD component (DsrE family)